MKLEWTQEDCQGELLMVSTHKILVILCPREFFHLLSTELVNPDYVLFECVDGGLYKPNKSSSVNPAHLHYFKLTGTMMAKAICEGKPFICNLVSQNRPCMSVQITSSCY